MTALAPTEAIPAQVLARPTIGHHRAQLERVTGLTWRERLDRYANAAALRQRRRQRVQAALISCHASVSRGADVERALDRLWEAVT